MQVPSDITWHFESPRTDEDVFAAYADALLPMSTDEQPILIERTARGIHIECRGVSGIRFERSSGSWVDGAAVTKRTFVIALGTYALSELSSDDREEVLLAFGAGAWFVRELVELIREPRALPLTERADLPARAIVRPLVPFFRDIKEFTPISLANVSPTERWPPGFASMVDTHLVEAELRAHANAGVHWLAPLYLREAAFELVAYARDGVHSLEPLYVREAVSALAPDAWGEKDFAPSEQHGAECYGDRDSLRLKEHGRDLADAAESVRARIPIESECPFDVRGQYLMRFRRGGVPTSFPVAPFLWLTACGAGVIEVAPPHSVTFVARLLASDEGAALEDALRAAFLGNEQPLRALRVCVPSREEQIAQGLAFALGTRAPVATPDP